VRRLLGTLLLALALTPAARADSNLVVGIVDDQLKWTAHPRPTTQILRDLGVRRMRLMTNNPSKYVAIGGYGLEIVERVPLEVHPTERSRKYLEAKKNKMGHLLKLV